MKRLVIASNNEGKIKEIKRVLANFPVEVLSLKDMGLDIDVEEDGLTFEDNAKKKSVEIYKELIKRNESNFIVMSDDSGLEVDYLKGEPGVFSARYAGEHGNDKKNNEKLLLNLSGVSDDNRKARFVCQLALINDKNEWECPQCGNKDHSKMNVTRRTCGYLGENFWNVGKTKEIKARVLHL